MRRRGLQLTLACLVVLLVSAARADGCTCGGPGSACAAYGASDAVFVGTVTEIRSKPRNETSDLPPRTVTFSVEEAFSGVRGAEMQVATGFGGGDCGYAFVKGSRYLVYAHRSGSKALLYTGMCTRTALAHGAAEDLEFLRGLARRPPGATVNGSVRRWERNAPEGTGRHAVGVEGVRVTLSGAGWAQELRTDAGGNFKAEGLQPGTYEATLHLPEGMTALEPVRLLKAADKGCASADFLLTENGRIAGRVTDAEGRPAAGLSLTLADADGKNPELRYGRHARADAEGNYRFEGLPPGRYLLGVRFSEYSAFDDAARAYPRAYYPGVSQAA
ncbi:MAG TPA: carboxypeptidase regulatory-like domain-containing protein, partial [Pyrinomonadaceae bacterium]